MMDRLFKVRLFNQVTTQQGFTLLELIITIVIVSIIAAVSVPRWTESINPSSAAERLAADIRYTQSLAMSHGQRFRINLSGTNTYSITTITGNGVPSIVTGDGNVTLAGITYGTFTNLPNNLIAFDGRGIPYTDGAATTTLNANASIPITSGGSTTRTIVISPTTGRVIVQ